jgi:hypothetical protein
MRTRDIDMVPPKGVRAACERGLALQEEFGGKGLVASTVAWARDLAEGKAATPQKVKKMRAWFARHAVDKRPGWARPPTPGYVAWLLWGGDAGERWARRVASAIERRQEH